MSNIRRIGNIVLGIVLAAVVAMKKEEQKSDDRK